MKLINKQKYNRQIRNKRELKKEIQKRQVQASSNFQKKLLISQYKQLQI